MYRIVRWIMRRFGYVRMVLYDYEGDSILVWAKICGEGYYKAQFEGYDFFLLPSGYVVGPRMKEWDFAD